MELLQHIAIARLFLFGSTIGLFILAFATPNIKKHALEIWATAVGSSWAIGAAAILLPAHTLLYGNQGDETFQIAFMEKVISGHPFSDFFYQNLSPFYPPLYFWTFGTLGRVFNWDGIQAAQWGSILTYAALPLAALAFTKLCSWSKREQLIALLLSIATLLFFPTDVLLLKPYEVVAALGSVLWIVAFVKLLKAPSRKLHVILGVSGGVIFLLYYFWFMLLIPAMIGLTIVHIFSSKSDRKLAARNSILSFITIGCVTTIISSPFLIPYVTDLITLGQENYQATYFFPSDAFLSLPWIPISIVGAVALGSIATFIKKPWTNIQVATLALISSILTWHIVQLCILAFGGKSIMLSKPFLFLGGILMMAPAIEWTCEYFSTHFESLRSKSRIKYILVCSIIACSPLLPNGLFIDQAQDQLSKNLLPYASEFVAENIRVFVSDYANRVWLTSGLQDIGGIIPLTHYLAWNPQFSHPAAHWGTRLENLRKISQMSASVDATTALDSAGVNALLFFKMNDESGTNFYPFFYEEDAWPNGTKSKEIRFSSALFDAKDWQIAHEDNEWIILLRTSE
jgi:hypothetical protein